MSARAITTSDIPVSSTNDTPAAGTLGEYPNATILRSANTAITTGVPTTVVSLSLSAGDWDVEGVIGYSLGGTLSSYASGITTTAAGIPDFDTIGRVAQNGLSMTGENSVLVRKVRISLATTTTVYLSTQATFTAGATLYGSITARRPR